MLGAQEQNDLLHANAVIHSLQHTHMLCTHIMHRSELRLYPLHERPPAALANRLSVTCHLPVHSHSMQARQRYIES